MVTPILSIVLPTFECTEGLEKIVQIFFESDLIDRHVEFVISDDSSTGVVEAFAHKHPRFRYVKHAANGNPVSNWNNGIKLARGQYIQVLHHDEYYDCLNDLLLVIDTLRERRPSVMSLQCLLEARFRNKLMPQYGQKKLLNNAAKYLFNKNFFGSPSVVIFLNDNNMFSERYTRLVDIQFYMTLLRKYSAEMWLISDIEMVSDLRLFKQRSITSSIEREISRLEVVERQWLQKEFGEFSSLSLGEWSLFYAFRAWGYVSVRF